MSSTDLTTDDFADGDWPAPTVSWAAIAAGTVSAIAATLILMALGAGLGFAAASPWGDPGEHAGAFAVMTGVWIIITQWLASGLGGYITGRLRERWVGTHTHEVFFRDTAHGLVTWATATAIVAALTVWAGVGGGSAAAKAAAAELATAHLAYDADAIFRSPTGDSAALVVARNEARTILATAASDGQMSPVDRDYLIASASARAGIAPADAAVRVDAALAREQAAAVKAREAADTARKAASALGFFTALSMLIGAFIACVAAALGGRQRDEHV
ncbi:hypothetical protein QO010_004394 [Caulobacter ginsengisoli]|uniref:Uncharacterized protein n=1 Tax=Caulobacter ginsengisoli TaxID=400775 RepID=A0ABU0IX69_9CAUL|nr:hypothetical protein [Caulobacter ginsengisoli]MDQ0466599.1 hypothetical protein [Caulobacter ginsengisoli]